MLYTSKIKIQDVTPLYHFKYGEIKDYDGYEKKIVLINRNHELSAKSKEGLRATEIKPRFINFLKYEVKNEAEFDNYTYLELSQKISININNNKMKIASKGGSLENKGIIGLSSKVDTKGVNPEMEKLKKTQFFLDGNATINLSVKCDDEKFLKLVDKYLKIFITTHSFGRRSKKGFGSFKVVNKDFTINEIDLDTKKELGILLDKCLPIEKVEEKITSLKKIKYLRQYTETNKYWGEENYYLYYIKTLLGASLNDEYKPDGLDSPALNVSSLYNMGNGENQIDKVNPPFRFKYNTTKQPYLFIQKDLEKYLLQYEKFVPENNKSGYKKAVEFLSGHDIAKNNEIAEEDFSSLNSNLYYLIISII